MARVGRALAVRLHAITFAAAGLCTLLIAVLPRGTGALSAAAILAGTLTLAGLGIIATGMSDERPLRQVPLAMPLLMTAAGSAVAKTVLLQAGRPLPVVLAASAVVGLIGGLAVALAVVLLLAARSRHRLTIATLTGLGLVGLPALVSNALLLVPGVDQRVDGVATEVGIVVTGAGLLLIALALARRPMGTTTVDDGAKRASRR
ncbi:hypothetical protein BIU98_07295 [Curtobacterium sp. MMLR14_010]|uniref:hypothetical protein n=1 Tax=Curtobacterium sp. MMLR14_010 TaxID=1898743 RepID=UPI0008DD63CE|nr:hypothetical protein [Curtobacterium sp. MMLR14_010]OII31578.1 hypothetical protein BIU98_07295 [Curtobacterium sp. MMLR14_010]